ncbi:hypothetical protein [Paenibacillus sp. NPDC055715]
MILHARHKFFPKCKGGEKLLTLITSVWIEKAASDGPDCGHFDAFGGRRELTGLFGIEEGMFLGLLGESG